MTSGLEERARVVRHLVYEHFALESRAPVVEELAEATGFPAESVVASLRALESSHDLKLVDGTTHILMAFPFSNVSTAYRVTRTNAQRYFANCAWDAIAFHPMLGEPIQVDSFCHHCGQRLRFGVADGRGIPGSSPLPLVYLGRPAATWWDDIVRTCGTSMVYFASRTHFEAWVSAHGPAAGAVLSVDQTAEISVPIYARKLELDYTRPPAAAREAAFRQAGLVGDFWRLPP